MWYSTDQVFARQEFHLLLADLDADGGGLGGAGDKEQADKRQGNKN